MEPIPARLDGPRGATPTEFGEVMDFLNFVFRSNVGRRPSMGGDYPHLYRAENARMMRHIRLDGRIVSSVSVYPSEVEWGNVVLKMGGIGGVATEPEFRKQGYAGQVLDDCLSLMESEDYDISILWTGIPDYYRRWGWEHAGTLLSYSIDRSTITYLPSAPSGEILTDGRNPRVIEGVYRLHAETKRGVVWDRNLTEIMINIPTRHKVLLLTIRDEPVAYVVHSYGQQADVKAYGGDPEAVLGLTRVVFGREGARSMRIHTPSDDTGVSRLLDERGLHRRPEYAGMLALINPSRILAKYGVEGTDVTPAEDGWNVTTNGRTVKYGRNDLVKFFFGPERPPGLSNPKLPLPIYYGPLDHM